MMLCKELNALPDEALSKMLRRCCGSSRWVQKMISSRPYPDDAQLFQLADEHWWSLEKEDFLEAFSHHPKIGGNLETLRQKFQSTHNWSEQEQSGVKAASEEVLNALSKGNLDYERRYGYIFIVCATGKSAAEMLALLEARIHNSPDAEPRIAAGEQAKITKLRMEKWTP